MFEKNDLAPYVGKRVLAVIRVYPLIDFPDSRPGFTRVMGLLSGLSDGAIRIEDELFANEAGAPFGPTPHSILLESVIEIWVASKEVLKLKSVEGGKSDGVKIG